MRVNIKLFASLHEVLGKRELYLELAEGATVGDLREALKRSYPVLKDHVTTMVCAVNAEYVPSSYRLGEGDEVALIPPVSGGANV